MQKERVINRDPEILGGTPVFAGTRVPVQTLIDYLAGGESLDDFLEGFPSVSREQAEAFLQIVHDEAFTSAIQGGKQTERVGRDEVFAELPGTARGMWKEQDGLPDLRTLCQEFDDRGASDSEADRVERSRRGRHE